MESPVRAGAVHLDGIDCSGFTRYIYSRFGVCLPRVEPAVRRALRWMITCMSSFPPGYLAIF